MTTGPAPAGLDESTLLPMGRTWTDVTPGTMLLMKHNQELFWKCALKPTALRVQIMLAQGQLKGIQ